MAVTVCPTINTTRPYRVSEAAIQVCQASPAIMVRLAKAEVDRLLSLRGPDLMLSGRHRPRRHCSCKSRHLWNLACRHQHQEFTMASIPCLASLLKVTCHPPCLRAQLHRNTMALAPVLDSPYSLPPRV